MKRSLFFLSLTAICLCGHLYADVPNAPTNTQVNPNIQVNPNVKVSPNTPTTPDTQPPSAGNLQKNRIQWFTKYSEALSAAKQQNKSMVLFFTGSDWCGWCKKIDSEVFTDPEFIRLAGDRFIFVELDFPMNTMLPLDISEQNAQLKHKYGITGYPTVVIINPEETFIAETGYRPGGGKAYAEYLLSLQQK